MLTCELPPTSGRIVFHGPRHHRHGRRRRVCQLGLTKSYQVNQLFAAADRAREHRHRGLGRAPRHLSLDLLRRIDRVPGLAMQVESTLALVGLSARADVPVAELAYGEKRRLEIGLALAASPSLLLLDEPLAGMSPRERAETVQLLQEHPSRPHAGRRRARHGRGVRIGRAHHRAARGRVARRGHARPRSSATASSRRPISAGWRRHECAARSRAHQQLLRRQPHPVRRVAARRQERGGGAARPQRRRQEHDVEEPDGRSTPALRPDRARRHADRRRCPLTRSPLSGCNWCRRSGASSAASTSRRT